MLLLLLNAGMACCLVLISATVPSVAAGIFAGARFRECSSFKHQSSGCFKVWMQQAIDQKRWLGPDCEHFLSLRGLLSLSGGQRPVELLSTPSWTSPREPVFPVMPSPALNAALGTLGGLAAAALVAWPLAIWYEVSSIPLQEPQA